MSNNKHPVSGNSANRPPSRRTWTLEVGLLHLVGAILLTAHCEINSLLMYHFLKCISNHPFCRTHKQLPYSPGLRCSFLTLRWVEVIFQLGICMPPSSFNVSQKEKVTSHLQHFSSLWLFEIYTLCIIPFSSGCFGKAGMWIEARNWYPFTQHNTASERERGEISRKVWHTSALSLRWQSSGSLVPMQACLRHGARRHALRAAFSSVFFYSLHVCRREFSTHGKR